MLGSEMFYRPKKEKKFMLMRGIPERRDSRASHIPSNSAGHLSAAICRQYSRQRMHLLCFIRFASEDHADIRSVCAF